MAKFFQANKSFVDYITMMGFQLKENDSDKKYYINEKGNQIRIDFQTNLITLLDSKGYVISYSTQYSNEEINKFLTRETELRDKKGLVIS